MKVLVGAFNQEKALICDCDIFAKVRFKLYWSGPFSAFYNGVINNSIIMRVLLINAVYLWKHNSLVSMMDVLPGKHSRIFNGWYKTQEIMVECWGFVSIRTKWNMMNNQSASWLWWNEWRAGRRTAVHYVLILMGKWGNMVWLGGDLCRGHTGGRLAPTV